MAIKTVDIEISGTTAILMHWDNIEFSDIMERWKADPKNTKKSKPGDDRTPPWRWMGCVYHDEKVVTIPSENIMRCIMEGAAQVPTGKGQKTFKAQSQSGLLCTEFHWPLMNDGKTIRWADIQACMDLETFPEHVELVRCLGFDLYVKRAKIGQAKHVRVRPRFEHWSLSGKIQILDGQITKDVLRNILEIAGQYKGLCDWRPGSKTPGPFGMFTATVA